MIKRSLYSLLLILFCLFPALGQSFIPDIMRDSARSDRLTGGRIEKAAFVPGNGDLKVTINVPAFKMTLWQSGKEIKTYPIGVGMLEFPIYIGRLRASSVEWNPVWIPPSSAWIEASSTVKAGEVILPTDPRNPLGKVKIPLGYGYLLHQAKGAGDMGSLVSHGCVRVMQRDLYDLAEKIVAARGLDVTPAQIATAKSGKKTLSRPLDPAIPVEITYDTIVVEAGQLHIYPDVYQYRKNTVENVRQELRSDGVSDRKLTDAAIRKMVALASGRKQFVVSVANVASGNAVAGGRAIPVVDGPTAPVRKLPVRQRKKSR